MRSSSARTPPSGVVVWGRRDPRVLRMGWLVCIFAAMSALTEACDDTFQPIAARGETLLPVFGYLDASADTQWIRVMPLRRLHLTSQDRIIFRRPSPRRVAATGRWTRSR